MNNKIIRTIIADDEPLARAVIKSYLADFNEFEIIDECGDGLSAFKAISEKKPDVLFLDIQMPKLTGIEIIELLENKPQIVFITAYDQFAINAFEHSACDYILKPFTKERLEQSLQKLRERLTLKDNSHGQNLTNLVETLNSSVTKLDRIAIKNGTKIDIISVDEIHYLQAEGDYVMIYTNQNRYLKEQTMKFFEARLNEKEFIRIHRSTIVHINQIKRIELFEKDSYVVILKNGTSLKTSNSGYKMLKEILSI